MKKVCLWVGFREDMMRAMAKALDTHRGNLGVRNVEFENSGNAFYVWALVKSTGNKAHLFCMGFEACWISEELK